MDRLIKTPVRIKIVSMLCISGMIVVISLLMGGGVASAHTFDIPGGNVSNPVVRAVDIAQPAVVRIITQIDGRLVVQFPAGAVTFPQNGSNGYPLDLSGTGTFISAHGDILTADHVVNPPHTDLDSFLQQTAAPDVAAYMNQVLHVNPQVTADQVTQELVGGQLNSTSQYDTPQSAVYLSFAFTGPLNATSFQNIPSNVFSAVDRIEAQSAVNQKDVAIIHVGNMNDMPMMQLGDSSGVQVQDQLSIIGFPGNGDVSNTPTNLLTSSVNTVSVSSIKTTDTGAPVIQVDGNVGHGDSGGPALDSSGKVVGIVSFGIGTQGITSFLQASNSARQLVQQLNLNTAPGAFQTAWNQAFNDYGATTSGHWHKAAQELQQLATTYPQFKGIAPYLAYAQQQAKTEKVTPTPTTTPTTSTSPSSFLSNNWPVLAGGALIVLAIVFFGTLLVRSRSKKPALAKSKQRYGASAATSSYLPPVNQGMPPVRALPQTPPQGQQAYSPPPPNVSRPAMPFGTQPASSPSVWSDQSASRPPAPAWPASQPSPQQALPRQQNSYAPGASGTSDAAGDRTQIMVHWPCGHMNVPGARFCSKCGEPAPQSPPPMRRYEQ